MAATLEHLTSVLNLSMRIKTRTPRFLGIKGSIPESLMATTPLTKEPEDSRYEIEAIPGIK